MRPDSRATARLRAATKTTAVCNFKLSLIHRNQSAGLFRIVPIGCGTGVDPFPGQDHKNRSDPRISGSKGCRAFRQQADGRRLDPCACV